MPEEIKEDNPYYDKLDKIINSIDVEPYYREKEGVLYCADCMDILPKIPEKSIDLTITSPPYDDLRDYEGYTFNFNETVKQLYRTIVIGGEVVWVVGDKTINGSESGNSFKQALYFKEVGFNLHDTMVYQKDTIPFPEVNRYEQAFEYMFVFSKGKPSTFNPMKIKTKGYKPSKSSTTRQKDGTTTRLKYKQGKRFRKRFNIWSYAVGYQKTTKDKIAFKHPAIFPEQLAYDHIYSWSNEGDIVSDPLCGRGTSLKMAKKLGRQWIGIEISQKYCDIAVKRLKKYKFGCSLQDSKMEQEKLGA